jgi:TrwC relaxase
MVSIGKLGRGQALYYLDQARHARSAATAIASGIEDYYTGGVEAAGAWIGAGSCFLGLRDAVRDEELHRVLAGQHPRNGELLLLRGSVPGFDVTFSAPKSVSLLFGIGDPHIRDAVLAAHGRAVADAFSYLERSAAVGRRGAGGVNSTWGDGLVAAAFLHRTSRAGDPQLHTHVLVANLVRGADGRWTALDARALYAHGRTAGTSTSPFCATSSADPEAFSGHPHGRGRPRSTACRVLCWPRSHAGARRSRRRWRPLGRLDPRRRVSQRSRRDGRRTTAFGLNSSWTSGASVPRASASVGSS